MKINSVMQGKYQTTDNLNTPKAHEEAARIAGQNFGYTLDISSKDKDITAFGMGELDSFEDIAAKASVKNVSLESDANAVMSNSMSEEDFAEYMKEGYSPSNMNIEETVTNLDKIKTVLLESGILIEGYNDDLSNEEISKITNSAALAEIIKSALAENYVPVTEENVISINDVISTSKELSAPTDDAVKFMLKNNMDVTVDNFYKAEFSSSSDSSRRPLYSKDSSGYTSVNPETSDFDQLRPQIENIISDSGLEINENTLNEAKWLLNRNLPITKENLERLEEINNISFPLDEKSVALSASAAISDGIKVQYAPLNKTEGDLKKAYSLFQDINQYVESIPAEDIESQRVLQELRLHMSTEANLYLLKKGIEIDTRDLTDLVEKLKEAERNIYKPLLNNEDENSTVSDKELDEKIVLFKNTENTLSAIKASPVESIANAYFGRDLFTLSSLNAEGSKLKADYAKAEKSYETIMTAPRKDMGDSIKKAFRNIDDILEDLDMEVNRINEKAVRSLGYSSMEINEENIRELSKANTAVENVISFMNPKRTLAMIRDGFNPLDMDMFDLEKELKKYESDLSTEKYSEFLWRLEKQGEISDDERAAFIGVYRLFNKIEKSDGKLVGNVLKANEKLTLNNLLTASRSNRAASMDISVDENFGALEKLITYGESITDQILKGFRNTSANASNENDDYIKEQFDDAKEALGKEDAITTALKMMDEPVTVNNIMAMDQLINNRGSAFKKLFDEKNTSAENRSRLKSKSSNLLSGFVSKDTADEAYADAIDEAKSQTLDYIEKATDFVDLKELQSVNRQLSIYSSMVKNSSYEVPVEINGELTTLNVKLIKDSDETGKVNISFASNSYGKVLAEFKTNGNKASAFIICENTNGISGIKNREDSIKSAINAVGIEIDSIFYTNKSDISISSSYTTEQGKKTPTNDLYSLAKAFIQSITE